MNQETNSKNNDGKAFDQDALEAISLLGIEGARFVVFFRDDKGPRMLCRLKDCPSGRYVNFVDEETGLRYEKPSWVKRKHSYRRESGKFALYPILGNTEKETLFDGDLLVETYVV